VEIKLHFTVMLLLLCVSLRFNGHFPDEPGLAWVSRYQNVSILAIIGAKGDGRVVITRAIRRAKLQSKCRHQCTNTQFFYRLEALPVAHSIVSKH